MASAEECSGCRGVSWDVGIAVCPIYGCVEQKGYDSGECSEAAHEAFKA
jgi:hypothetical protein